MSYDPQNAKSIFLQALEIGDEQQRTEWLDQTCQGQADLRRRVEELLVASQRDHRLLDEPLPEIPLAQFTDEATLSMLTFLEPTTQPGRLGRLGIYEIIEVLGRGGMGIVLRAIDTKLQRVVAIKVLAPHLALSERARQRFLREARAAAAVRHDHLVTIHAVEDGTTTTPAFPYLVMECIVGQSLQQKIDREGALSDAQIVRLGRQIAAGLAAAHAQGLIHRDIKPANILLENGIERVKITDFGLARFDHEAGLTQSGQIAGTPQYMSPEQAEGRPIDHRSDLFSLGSVLYAMATGQPAFVGDSAIAVIRRVCDEPPRAIRELNATIAPAICDIIDQLLAKEPSQRIQSAQEVVTRFEKLLTNGEPTSSSPRQQVSRTRSTKSTVADSATVSPIDTKHLPYLALLVLWAVAAYFLGWQQPWTLAALVATLVSGIGTAWIESNRTGNTSSQITSLRPGILACLYGVLVIVHFASALQFFSFHMSSHTEVEVGGPSQATALYQFGAIDPWFRLEIRPEPTIPFRWRFFPLSRSAAYAVLGYVAIALMWRIEVIRKPSLIRWNHPRIIMSIYGALVLISLISVFSAGLQMLLQR